MYRRRTMESLHVWDPNGLNPYGQEVHAVIRKFYSKSVMWLPRETTVLSGDHRNVYRLLGRSAGEDGFLDHLLRRLIAPVLLALRAVCRQEAILLVWTRGFYENLVFTLAALLTRVVIVHHNPVASRMGGFWQRHSFLKLTRAAHRTLVHSSIFLPEKAIDLQTSENYRTVIHPLYDSWSNKYAAPKKSSGNKTKVLVLGALRKDKGADQLNDLASLLDPTKYQLLIVGTGTLPNKFREICAKRNLETSLTVSPRPLEDSVIADALAGADVLLAPYENATISGTIIMAQTVGLPTITYDVGALRDEVEEKALSRSKQPSDLVKVLDEWRCNKFPTYRTSAAVRGERVVTSWAAALSD